MTTIFSIVVVVAVTISLSILLILVLNLRRMRRTDSMLAGFHEAAEQFGLSLSKRDFLGNSIIGLDKAKNKLLFFTASRKKQDGYLVDLSEIKSVTYHQEYGLMFTEHSRKKAAICGTNKVFLRLIYKSDVPSLDLPFYEIEKDPAFEIWDREKLAKEWKGLLTAQLEGREYKEPRKPFLVKPARREREEYQSLPWERHIYREPELESLS